LQIPTPGLPAEQPVQTGPRRHGPRQHVPQCRGPLLEPGGCFDGGDRPLPIGQFDHGAPRELLNLGDRTALYVEQVAKRSQQNELFRAVEAPTAAAAHRLYDTEFGLPEPQHMSRLVELRGRLRDRPERLRRLVDQSHPIFAGRGRCAP